MMPNGQKKIRPLMIMVLAATLLVSTAARLGDPNDRLKKVLAKKCTFSLTLKDGTVEERTVSFDGDCTMVCKEKTAPAPGQAGEIEYRFPLPQLDSGPMAMSPFNDQTNRVGILVKCKDEKTVIQRVEGGAEPTLVKEATIVVRGFKTAEKAVRALRSLITNCAEAESP